MVKNPPSVKEIQVQSLVGEDPLEKEMQPAPVFFPGKSHGQRSLAGYSPRGYKRVRQDLATKTAKQITKETLQKFMEKQKDTSCQKLHFTTFGPKQIK